MEITAELVEKAKNGDSGAWSELYSATFPVAYGVAVQLVKNKDTAEDIIQDSYITAFTKLDTLNEQDKFQHWFNRIVANNCKNFLVKKKPDLFSQHATYNEDGDEMEFDVVDDRTEYQPDNAVITSEIKELFYEMVAKLPEEQRTCALMFWVQELTIPEIAEILGVSQNTVKSRIHYAKKKLTAEADDMKKKGISVFSFTGFALIPFLRWLFKSGSGITASPEKAEGIIKIAKSAGTISKSANTVNAVGTTAKTAATVAAKTATKSIAVKVIAGVLAASIGIGGITYAVKNKIKDIIKGDTLTTLADEQSSQDEIINADSLAELRLNPEMVKSVTAILSSEYVRFSLGEASSYPEYTTEWFRTYWVYYYLTMNGYYNGNELKRNEQFQSEIVSKYGEYTDSLYPDKEACGIPDYDSFSKLYECLYGTTNVETEYEKLKFYVTKRKAFPTEYGLRPIDINFDDEKFISLGNGEYQVEYTITTCHSTGDLVFNADGYDSAYASPKEVYKYVMSFKMDDKSPLDFDVIDSYMEQIDSYWVITYVHKNGETETVTTREDIETFTSREDETETIPHENELKRLVGIYKGSYFPGQGETGLMMNVYKENDQYIAQINFYNLPGKTNSKSGSFYSKVTYDENSGTYLITPDKWIDAVSGYTMLKLNGSLKGDVFKGTSEVKFELKKLSDGELQKLENGYNKVVGTYKGSYFANQGETGLTLTIYREGNYCEAVFEFYNLPGQTNAEKGKYYMNVYYDIKTDTYTFEPDKWIEKPPTYIMLSLFGSLNGKTLSGQSPTKFSVAK